MPEFFVPPRRDTEDDELWWHKAREQVEAAGANCGNQRIFRLRYVSNGTEIVAEVGKIAEIGDGRMVVGAIFDTPGSYIIRAVVGGTREVPTEDVREVVDFDV